MFSTKNTVALCGAVLQQSAPVLVVWRETENTTHPAVSWWSLGLVEVIPTTYMASADSSGMSTSRALPCHPAPLPVAPTDARDGPCNH